MSVPLLYLSGTLESYAWQAMTQLRPTSAQVIYDTLVADAVFMANIGTYEFTTGTPVPAISIVSPGEDLPVLRNVKGIECIIQDVGDMSSRSYLTSTADIITTWSVFLVVWNPAKGKDMHAAATQALKRFGGSEAVQTVATSDGLGALVQTKIVISSDNAILAP